MKQWAPSQGSFYELDKSCLIAMALFFEKLELPPPKRLRLHLQLVIHFTEVSSFFYNDVKF